MPPARVPSPPATSLDVPRREIVAWAGYDFANSSFTTVMVTVVFPVYFTTVLCEGRADAERLWAWAGVASNLAVVLLGPLVGQWADRHAAKKRALLLTTGLCLLGTVALGWVPAGAAMVAIGLFILANFGFALGENLCAAFLPELSRRETAGRISSYGWAIGYAGGLVSLLLVLPLPPAQGVQVTALFFLMAALPTFLFLRERAVPQPDAPRPSYGALMGLVRELPELRWFLLSFFFASAGLSTVVYFAGIFAKQELGMSAGELQVMFLALQFSAAAGALGFGWWQDRSNSRLAFGTSLVVWMVVVVGCYFTRSVSVFYVFAALAGVGMGSTQSCARAAISKLIPPERAATFFGIWGFCGKLAPVVALLLFGELAHAFDLRTALLGTLGLFIASLLFLMRR